MKRILSLLLISAILTGCGHISDDSPDVAEETTTASQITETIASDTTEAVTSDVAVTNEVTTVNSSQSVTDITTTAAGNTNGEPKKENKKTQNSQDHNAQEVKQNENRQVPPAQSRSLLPSQYRTRGTAEQLSGTDRLLHRSHQQEQGMGARWHIC